MNSRAQFEKWQRSIGGDTTRYTEDYDNHFVNEDWRAWQASREALVVEIPKGLLLVEEADVIDDIVNQLDKAGIKWK